jgi:hypothetical protein
MWICYFFEQDTKKTVLAPILFVCQGLTVTGSWNSPVTVATRIGQDERGIGVRYSALVKVFFHLYVQAGSGAYSASVQCVQGAPFSGVERPRHEADHPLPSCAEVKNTYSYSSTFPYLFMMWCLIKLRVKFTFYLLPTITIIKLVKLV